jgi:hypothetical protein
MWKTAGVSGRKDSGDCEVVVISCSILKLYPCTIYLLWIIYIIFILLSRGKSTSSVQVVDIVDIGEELGQMETEVKIALPMSNNTLTIAEEYIQYLTRTQEYIQWTS